MSSFVGTIRNGFYFSITGSVIKINDFAGYSMKVLDGKWCIHLLYPINEILSFGRKEDAMEDAELFNKAMMEILDAEARKKESDPA